MATSGGKLQVRTAAEREALRIALDEVRASVSMAAGDLDPRFGGHDVGDGGETLARLRRVCAHLTDILEGRL